MNLECTNTMVLSQHYDQARRRILAALKKHVLHVAFDFNVASSILRSSGVRLPKSSVLGVDCPYKLLEAFVADGAAAVFLPLHVVLSEHGTETQIRILAPQTLRAAGITPAIAIPVHHTLRRLYESLASTGARSAKSTHDGQRRLEIESVDESLQEEVTGA